jgi:hypothetical protein
MAVEYITVLDGDGNPRKVAADVFDVDKFAQVFKVAYGADGVVTLAEDAAPLPVGVSELPAADDTTDTISAATMIAKLKSSRTDVTPAQDLNSIAASQSHATLVDAVSQKSIVVVAAVINWGDTTASTVTFESGTTAISPPFKGAPNGVMVLPFNEAGWFTTATGQALAVSTGAGSTTLIHLVYGAV